MAIEEAAAATGLGGFLGGPYGALLGKGLESLVGVLTGNQNRDLTREQLAQQAALAREQMAQLLAIFNAERSDKAFQFNADREDKFGQTALDAMKMDPLLQQKSRQKNALLASLLSRSTMPTMAQPGSGLKYDYADIAPFFTEQARANAENQFTSNAAAASGGRYRGPSGVGYSGATAPTPTTPLSSIVKPLEVTPVNPRPPVLPSSNKPSFDSNRDARRADRDEYDASIGRYFDDNDPYFGRRRARRYGE